MTISIEAASPPVTAEIESLLRDSNDTRLDLVAVASEKLFGPGRFGPTTALLARLDGELAGVVAGCGRYIRILAVKRELRRRGVGSALLRAITSIALDAGATTQVAGAESGNYFVPGIDSEDAGTLAFFQHHGFVRTSGAVNLEASTRQSPPDDTEHYRFAAPADRDRVLRFVRLEFGNGWLFEVERALAASPHGLILALREEELLGFAAIDAVNRGLGTFGPAGVAARERGSGTGRGLLLMALLALRDRGYERCIIQWAAAVPFYQKSAGARIFSHYEILSREIGADSDRVRNR